MYVNALQIGQIKSIVCFLLITKSKNKLAGATGTSRTDMAETNDSIFRREMTCLYDLKSFPFEDAG